MLLVRFCVHMHFSCPSFYKLVYRTLLVREESKRKFDPSPVLFEKNSVCVLLMNRVQNLITIKAENEATGQAGEIPSLKHQHQAPWKGMCELTGHSTQDEYAGTLTVGFSTTNESCALAKGNPVRGGGSFAERSDGIRHVANGL